MHFHFTFIQIFLMATLHDNLIPFVSQESDTDTEPYDDEEFEGYEDKIDSGSPSKNKDPITIVDVSKTIPILINIMYNMEENLQSKSNTKKDTAPLKLPK